MPGDNQAPQRERTATPFGNGDELYFQEASDHISAYETLGRDITSEQHASEPRAADEYLNDAIIFEIGKKLTPEDASRLSSVIVGSREQNMDPAQTRFLRDRELAA